MSVVDVFLLFVYWLAGMIVLAEALNKLERTDVRQRGATVGMRMVMLLKLIAWALLAVGAAGAVVTPLLQFAKPGLNDLALLLGFAVLIIRTRVKDEVL